MNEIRVRISRNFSQERIYPACPNAEHFTAIAQSATLTQAMIEHIKALGFKVIIEQNEVKL